MATPFTVFSGTDNTLLTSALLALGSGITVSSIVLKTSGQDAVNFYDGSLASLGIGPGLLLTSGTTPGTTNTVGWFGTNNSTAGTFNNGDADIDAVVNTVFQTQSYDATTLEFDFSVADPNATSVSFDLVFGSDEYPEWVDQFVDSAIVMVNGVNYALFNHDPLHPLSVVSANLAAGYFQDNAGNTLPIEYDGVSHVLKIVAPIIPGGAPNHIKIGIADTGDHIYDSGIFIANFSAGNIPGSGVVITPPSGTDNSDVLTGSSQDEYFNLKGGDDTCYAGAGDDIVVAGSGNDVVYGGSGADQMKGDAGDDSLDGGADVDTAVFSNASSSYLVADVGGGFTITDTNAGPASEGVDTLTNVELVKFSNGLFALGAGGILTPVTDPGTPPANTPGSVVISGIGSAGKTLTATVSDPDGISGAVSYQWQISNDNGANWSDIAGAVSNTYTVSATDVGLDIQVLANYTDNGSNPESPVSAAKSIQETEVGDLIVTLIQLKAPVGASTINPLTTLVQDAIDLGLSPNMAALAIKTVLSLPDGINLPSYDAYAVLQINPSEPTALAVEKVAVEVAILTSLSDDDTGVNLTLKILEAAANNQTLDLADANDLANILGIDTTTFDINDKDTYPEPLREIFDRHENIAQATTVSDIEMEWQDFLSIQDGVNSTTIADLSIHVNQAPTGTAITSLADGMENTPYIVNAIDLLQGFSDSDGGTLSVNGLSADNGAVVDNGDGTFTITPLLNYIGPVELTYVVEDGQGGSTSASQMLVIAASPLSLEAGADASLNEGDIFTRAITFSDGADNGAPGWDYQIDYGDGTAIVSGTTLAMSLELNHQYTDGDANRTVTVSLTDVAGETVNDSFAVMVNNVAPDLTATGNTTGMVGQLYTLALSNLIDPGTDTLADNGISVNWGDGSSSSYSALGNVTHSFATTGSFNVAVSLTDEDGSYANVAGLSVDIQPVLTQTVTIGNAPERQSGFGGQWAAAWTNPEISIVHKADVTNTSEAWSAVKFSGVSPQKLAGGDVFAGDLGVSGQSVATSNVRQEIDGTEGLRFDLGHEASALTLYLTHLFTQDDGSAYVECGRLRLLDAAGNVVGESLFQADNTNGTKQISVTSDVNFTAVELVAGVMDGNAFVFGGYANADGSFGSAVTTDTSGVKHGSDFLVDAVQFELPVLGVPVNGGVFG